MSAQIGLAFKTFQYMIQHDRIAQITCREVAHTMMDMARIANQSVKRKKHCNKKIEGSSQNFQCANGCSCEDQISTR